MSFSTDIKDELARIQLTDEKEKRAVLIGITSGIGTIALRKSSGVSVKYTTESESLVRLVSAVAPSVYDVKSDEIKSSGSFGKTNNNIALYLSGKGAKRMLYDSAILNDGKTLLDIVKNMSEDEVMLFLRGAFIASGVATDPMKAYRVEFVTKSSEFCTVVVFAAAQIGIALKISERNGSKVAYVKDSALISDLLVMMGAVEAMLRLETILVERTVKNDANRATNCLVANIDKTVSAAILQCSAIHFLFKRGIPLPTQLMVTAQARLENPEAPLSELAEILKMGRSGVNHRLQKLMEIAYSEGFEA